MPKYRLKGIRSQRLRRLSLLTESKGKSKEASCFIGQLVFLVIALIAGVLGFTGVAIAAAGVAKLLFFVLLVLFVISLVTHLTRRGRV